MSAIDLLHRHVWQRLPYDWRRAMLFHATSLAAPRPGPAAPALPVIVAGALRNASGLGASARLCLDALRADGVPAVGHDLTSALMQDVDLPDGGPEAPADLPGPGTVILHVNAPLVPLAMMRLGRRLLHSKHVVGYWAWELPQVPAEWCHGVPFVHEIWVPSTFTAEAVRPIAGGRPVRVLPHAVAAGSCVQAIPTRAPRDPDHPFTVLTIFNMASSLARKNPLGAIAAFRAAFGEGSGARLIVKASNMGVHPAGAAALRQAARGPNIELVERTMSAAEIERLYRESDVVVSLHRAEGFGLTIAEAMLHGLPVIATDWSGSADFLSAETGIPVPCSLIAAHDPQGTYQHPGSMWAEPDMAAAAGALVRLRQDRALGQRLGRAGAELAAQSFSGRRYALQVRRWIEGQGSATGPRQSG